MVTWATSVLPTICEPWRAKCSSQRSILGLNNLQYCPVTGAREPMSEPLARLQRAHEKARFEGSVRPPCLRLMT